MFPLLVAGLAVLIGLASTQRVARHGASGMTAGMAAMMAAMGSGLSVGYAAGMVWDLGWATLAGVVAGFAHGLWMGRRYGPMAALDGAGGGVMGGLMGPMLAVMLLYLPLSLLLTAVLMLALQAAFGAGAVYLVAATAGGVGATGWLGLVGRVLGAESETVGGARDHYGALGVSPNATAAEVAEAFLAISRRAADQPERLEAAREALAVLTDPVRRAKYEAARQEDAACCPPKARARRRAARGAAEASAGRGGLVRVAALVASLALVLAFFSGALFPDGSTAQPGPAEAARFRGPAAAPASRGTSGGAPPQAGAAVPVVDGVQQVTVTLQGGSYSPKLIEVKRGVPVQLTLQAIGSPG